MSSSSSRSSAGRIEFVTSTSNPDGRWLAQQARNLLILLAERKQSFRLLLHDRDSKFSGGFDQIFRSEDMKIVLTPIRAPEANAYAERWVGTLRRVPRPDPDRQPPPARARAPRLHRPLQPTPAAPSLSLRPPDESASGSAPAPAGLVRKRELLGGLINQYKAAA